MAAMAAPPATTSARPVPSDWSRSARCAIGDSSQTLRASRSLERLRLSILVEAAQRVPALPGKIAPMPRAILIALLALPLLSQSAPPFDVVILNGRVLDGSGNP